MAPPNQVSLSSVVCKTPSFFAFRFPAQTSSTIKTCVKKTRVEVDRTDTYLEGQRLELLLLLSGAASSYKQWPFSWNFARLIYVRYYFRVRVFASIILGGPIGFMDSITGDPAQLTGPIICIYVISSVNFLFCPYFFPNP